jgi:hypothetical protein
VRNPSCSRKKTRSPWCKYLARGFHTYNRSGQSATGSLRRIEIRVHSIQARRQRLKLKSQDHCKPFPSCRSAQPISLTVPEQPGFSRRPTVRAGIDDSQSSHLQGQSQPNDRLRRQFAPRFRNAVVASRTAPFDAFKRLHQSVTFQLVKRWIQSTLFEVQYSLRTLFDSLHIQ